MPSGLIPLFPLQIVVFPGTPLPLHIFEERYKEMVGNAIRDNSEFGIVLAQEEGIVNAGCTVVVEKLNEMYPVPTGTLTDVGILWGLRTLSPNAYWTSFWGLSGAQVPAAAINHSDGN